MAELSLSVTKRVLAYTQGGRDDERQIAYASPSADIAEMLANASKANPVKVMIAAALTLVIADRGAIWRAHNAKFSDDFDALYALLARYPSKRMRFLCEIVD